MSNEKLSHASIERPNCLDNGGDCPALRDENPRCGLYANKKKNIEPLKTRFGLWMALAFACRSRLVLVHFRLVENQIYLYNHSLWSSLLQRYGDAVAEQNLLVTRPCSCANLRHSADWQRRTAWLKTSEESSSLFEWCLKESGLWQLEVENVTPFAKKRVKELHAECFPTWAQAQNEWRFPISITPCQKADIST